METLTKIRKSRGKKVIPQMMPIKKWLSLSEACSYMDLSINIFQDLASKNRLTISVIGAKKYFKVAELESLIEENVLIRKIS